MPAPRRLRYTIGQLMVVIAFSAGLLAAPRLGVVCVAGVLTTLVLVGALLEMVLGKSCPACARRALRRLARHRHYYRCSACRARFKRFGSGPWLDASGPEDEDRYRRPAGIWKGYAAPKELKGTSSGVLLGSKRSRDLPGEVRRRPPRPAAGRRLEEAERKVRQFLKNLHDLEE
jgi:hypothetical protein